MEQVFPVEMGLTQSNGLSSKSAASVSTSAYKEGLVENVLESGNWMVVLDDGNRVEVRGSGALKSGSRVRVLLPAGPLKAFEPSSTTGFLKAGRAEGLEWFVMIPLAFGGDKASARLEVFVERQKEGAGPKMDLAAYFVFTVQTEEGGEVQWSIHLKGRQVALQVYAPIKEDKKEYLTKLVREVETSLRKRGFVLAAPAVLLSRPFKVPAGFRLNVRG